MSARAVPSFDGLATLYATLERLTFGNALSRRRRCFLPEPRLARARRALVLGDGDGRFTAALLERYPALEVTAVDCSRGMLTRLEARVRRNSPRASLDLQCADARAWTPGAVSYDVVAAHFFFDCFSTSDAEAIVASIVPALSADACWVVSEFAVPPHGIARFVGWLLVRALYLAFRILTGLDVTRLPDHGAALSRAGFARVKAETGLGGILRSELWARRDVTLEPGTRAAMGAADAS